MEIVNAIIQYIQMIGGIAIRINSGMRVIQDSNGSTRVFRGAPAGTSDIIACLPGGQFWAIECKTRKGRTTPAQDEFLQRVREAGGVGIVARSIEDVQAALEAAYVREVEIRPRIEASEEALNLLRSQTE